VAVKVAGLSGLMRLLQSKALFRTLPAESRSCPTLSPLKCWLKAPCWGPIASPPEFWLLGNSLIHPRALGPWPSPNGRLTRLNQSQGFEVPLVPKVQKAPLFVAEGPQFRIWPAPKTTTLQESEPNHPGLLTWTANAGAFPPPDQVVPSRRPQALQTRFDLVLAVAGQKAPKAQPAIFPCSPCWRLQIESLCEVAEFPGEHQCAADPYALKPEPCQARRAERANPFASITRSVVSNYLPQAPKPILPRSGLSNRLYRWQPETAGAVGQPQSLSVGIGSVMVSESADSVVFAC